MGFFRISILAGCLFFTASVGSWGQIVVWNGHLGDVAVLADGAVAAPTLSYVANPDFCGPCDAFCNSGQPAFFGYSVADDAFNTATPPGIDNPPYVEAQVSVLPDFDMDITGLELHLWSYENFNGTQWGPRKVDIGWSLDGISWTVETHDINTDNDDCQTFHTPANASYIQVPVNVNNAETLYLRLQFYEANGTNDIGNFETDIFQISVAGSVCFAGDANSFVPLEDQVQILCPGDSLFLTTTMENWPLQYSWTPALTVSDPDQPNTWVTPTAATSYTVQVRDECGFFYQDTVTIPVEDSIPGSILQDPPQACEGETITLTAVAPPDADLIWSTGSIEPEIEILTDGDYQLTISQGNCSRTLAQNISFQPFPSVTLPEQATLCLGYPLILNVQGDSAEYRWNTGQTGPVIEVLEPGLYNVSVSRSGCTAVSEVEVEAEVCDCTLYFPNIFSPDFDGINDRFGADISCAGTQILQFELLIFSRWGELVFRGQSPTRKWDGRFRGQIAPAGVYTYLAVFTLKVGEIEIQQQRRGDLMLLR